MIKVLFICHGNICRSTMAEFVMKELVRREGLTHEFLIQSAATSREEISADTHPGTKRELRAHGIPYAPRQAVQLTAQDYTDFDYIIGMDSINIKYLNRMLKGDPDGKVSKLLDYTSRKGADIADPWYTGNFDATYRDVNEGCDALLAYILEQK